MTADVLVDLGRSHVRVVADGVDVRTPSGAGLTDRDGSARAARTVAAAVRGHVRPAAPWRLAVCAPGAAEAVDRRAEVADQLAAAFDPPPQDVLVVGDSAAWQVGAFAGGDGAVVALGTGAVVTARVGASIVRLDGRGLLLGDVGGGAWIGLRALRRADGEPGALRELATARFGDGSTWPQLLGEPDLAARLAAFVPDVVAAADRGVDAAVDVLDTAADGLAATLSALPADVATCAVGGLAAVLMPRLRSRTTRTWVEPAGDAIDGLRILLTSPGAYADELTHGRPAADAAHDTDGLATESVANDTDDLDAWPTERLVARLADGHRPAVQAVLDAVPALARAAELAGDALAGHGRLVYVGAGTPGRLAVQDAAELTPTFGLDPDRTLVLLAGGSAAGTRAIEGAEDDAESGAAGVDQAGIGADDVVVGVSASGRTPYVLAALRRAGERGASTVAVCNVADSPLAAAAAVPVELLTGAEVLAGSTRLAAGTAQKIALNTLSTAAMIRSGATYGPWMVDMLATNDKLRRRAVRIVRDATRVSDAEAAALLTAADQSVRVALVMALADVGPDGARALLSAGGSVRRAVAVNRAVTP